ncbi:MAG: YceI family protein [Maricaulaceae bacterium]
MRTLMIAALASALAAPAFAQVSTDPADAPAGRYAIDPAHAGVTWKISHFGLSEYTARFDGVSGELTFDPANPANSTLNASVDVTSISTGLDDFDKELTEEANFFNAAEYPTIDFTATDLAVTGENTGTMTGDLTLRGVTQPVTFDVTFYGGRPNPFKDTQYRLGFQGVTTIKRSEFGFDHLINFGIGDEVDLIIEAEFGEVEE